VVASPPALRTTRRQRWAAALTLPGQPDLAQSLVVELAAFLEQPVEEVEARCRLAAGDLARAWRNAAPATPAAITAFYRDTDAYLYDLTWWHTLAEDESALVQVEALEAALAHHARSALDFGGGIGSLGLLLARHGLEVTLADVNARLNAYARWRFARRGLHARVIDLPPGAPDLPVAAFDFISAVDVFEHLPEPGTTLVALAAALRPGGALFIHLPGNADAGHPMHLWRQPATLLRHLEAAGLWLEGESSQIEPGGNARLLLRRGQGPRYRLNQGLELRADTAGGTLLSLRPLVALRLNQQAFDTLATLNGGSTALEVVADHPGLSLPTTTTFLDALARRRLLVKQPAPVEHLPSVSAIVPAHGRPEATRACVESLLAQHYPAELLEVIVVDDASNPPLAPALAGLPIRLLRQEENTGQSAARNRAAELARGEVLAFLDNDCVAAPDWLRTLVAALDEPGVEIAGGRVLAPPPEGPVAAFEAVRSPLDMGPVSGAVGPGEPISYMPSCNLAIRRNLLLRIGGFDPAMRLGEDVDLIWRALATGAQARYVAEGAVVHHHRVRLGALLRRRADYASSEADLQRRHPAGRRTMALPRVTLALLAALVLAWSAPVLAGLIVIGASFALMREIRRKQRDLRRHGVHLPWHQVSAAVLQQHRAALYHLGANVTRYYSLPLLAAALLWRPLLPALLLLCLTPPALDYHRLRPQVALPLFVGLYWLELCAYQVGVWRGCRQRRTLRPLVPARVIV